MPLIADTFAGNASANPFMIRNPAGAGPSQTSYDIFHSTRLFASLDGLRALSILAVLWFHCARGQLPIASAGAHGVTLFFAISGFLITTLLLRERERTGSISLTGFYARRSLRIFPLYYAVLLVYVGAVAIVEPDSEHGRAFFSHLKYYATYTSNLFVPLDGRTIFYFAWSLATEEQFYLVWPSIEKFLGRFAKHVTAGLAVAIVIFWQFVAVDALALPHGSLIRSVALSVAPAILLGVALAHGLHSRRGHAVLSRVLGNRAASLGAMALLLCATITQAPHLLVSMCAVLLVGACVVNENHLLAKVLQWRPFVSIGTVSYGMYLLHMLVVNATERSLHALGWHGAPWLFPIVTLLTWGAAWVSYRWYESPFLRMKARFAR